GALEVPTVDRGQGCTRAHDIWPSQPSRTPVRGTVACRAQGAVERGRQRLQVVAAFEHDADAGSQAFGVAGEGMVNGLKEPGVVRIGETHRGQRIALVRIEAGADQHQLWSVLLQDRTHDALESRMVNATIRP